MPMAGKGLAKLIEECGELTAVAGKKLAYYRTDVHPDGAGSLKRRLEEEIADVQAACDLVIQTFELDFTAILERAKRKRELFERWHRDPDNAGDAIDAPQGF